MPAYGLPVDTRRTFSIAAATISALVLSGCDHAPSVDIFGSFFPIWMFCLVGGISLTVAIRVLLVRARLDGELGPRVIVYPSMVALFACTIWLVWFRF